MVEVGGGVLLVVERYEGGIRGAEGGSAGWPLNLAHLVRVQLPIISATNMWYCPSSSLYRTDERVCKGGGQRSVATIVPNSHGG